MAPPGLSAPPRRLLLAGHDQGVLRFRKLLADLLTWTGRSLPTAGRSEARPVAVASLG